MFFDGYTQAPHKVLNDGDRHSIILKKLEKFQIYRQTDERLLFKFV